MQENSKIIHADTLHLKRWNIAPIWAAQSDFHTKSTSWKWWGRVLLEERTVTNTTSAR